jgi:ribosomal protein S18 acetylase RimI-like enzyme
VKIRNFRLNDYAQVLHIWRATNLDQEGASLDSIAKQISWDSELILVAEEDEKVIGVIMGSIDGNRAYFYRLSVLPEFQRRGIGHQLVSELENRFRAKGVTEVVIMVNQNSRQALSFYRSLGYQVEQLVTLSKSIG